MSGAWWGVDPGTANAALVRLREFGGTTWAVDIIDIVSVNATKGGKKSPALPKRRRLRVWLGGEAATYCKDFPEAEVSLAQIVDWGLVFITPEPVERVVVERVLGNIHPDLAETAGVLRGLLWARCLQAPEPQRVTSSAWRKRMLDLPGTTPAVEAERVAVARVREEVPGWPVEASGHAAEAYWIARWGAECAG